MDWKDALKVGVAQCLAMIPGTSRSGATIIGGLIFGLSRKAATEFSFFLAIPTIFGATVWDLWQAREQLVAANLPGLAVGTVVSFFSALVVVHWAHPLCLEARLPRLRMVPHHLRRRDPPYLGDGAGELVIAVCR